MDSPLGALGDESAVRCGWNPPPPPHNGGSGSDGSIPINGSESNQSAIKSFKSLSRAANVLFREPPRRIAFADHVRGLHLMLWNDPQD